MVNKGPLWSGHTLPYGLGVRLQQQWINLPGLRQALQPQCAVLQDWLGLLGLDDPKGQEQELSLLANTWRSWRGRCIQQPKTFAKWVTIQGGNILDDLLSTGRPIILVSAHTAIRAAAIKPAVRQRTSRPIWGLSYSPAGNMDAVAKVIKAREILLQKGIVFVAGDGGQGTKGIELPLCGYPWLFRMGGPELALETDAMLLPVFNTLARTGHITVTFLPPLHSTRQTRQAQCEDLTRQYAALLVTHWPSLLSNMKWTKLQQIMDYSTKGAQ